VTEIVLKPRGFQAPGLLLPHAPAHRDPLVAMTPDERALTGMIHHANHHQPGELPLYAYHGMPVYGWDWRRRLTVDVSERALGIRDRGDRKWTFGAGSMKNQIRSERQ